MAEGVQSPADVTVGDLAELMGVFNEVTARLEATQSGLREEVSRLRAELSEANEQLARSRRLAALGEMAAGIAHEIRNPLASITLYARMLREDLAGQPALAEVAGKIEAGVRGLNAIVTDVLAFARESRVDAEWVDLGAVLDGAVASVEEGSCVCVERAYSRCRGVRGFVDEGLMRRALENVIRNAVEASEEGGGGRVRVEAHAGAGWLEVAVEDDGPGIPEEVADRVFNPFFTTRKAGTGLGLAIVHRIVDAHGGAVGVGRSSLGGARVTLRVEWGAQDRPEISTCGVGASDVAVRPRSGRSKAKEAA